MADVYLHEMLRSFMSMLVLVFVMVMPRTDLTKAVFLMMVLGWLLKLVAHYFLLNREGRDLERSMLSYAGEDVRDLYQSRAYSLLSMTGETVVLLSSLLVLVRLVCLTL